MDKGEVGGVITGEWFTESIKNEEELPSACEWKGSQWTRVKIAACATPVPLGPCREFIFAREFVFANERLASHSYPP